MKKDGKKKSNETPIENLLKLYTILVLNRRKFTLNELMERIEVSKPTMIRYLQTLELSGLCCLRVEQEKRINYYWVERANGNLPKISLTPAGLEQLALCRDFMLHLFPDKMRNEVDLFLQQSASFLPATSSGSAKFPTATEPTKTSEVENYPEILNLGQVLSKGSIDYKPFQPTLQTLIRAIRQKKVCRLTYQSTGPAGPKKPTAFDYAPKLLISFNEAIYVRGWKVSKTDPPTQLKKFTADLALHRIKTIELTDRSAQQLPQPQKQEEKRAGFFGYMDDGGIYRAKVKFLPPLAMYVTERQWSDDQTIEEIADGGIILSFTARSLEELRAWVLGFGSNAEALAPPSLLCELQRESEKVRKMYRDLPATSI